MSWRSMVYQHTQGTLEHLEQPRTLYLGTDITAPALHAGHLVPLLFLKRLQEAGHKTIVLLGGATSLIGDPTGRNSQRPSLSPEEVATNERGIEACVRRVLGSSALVVNNRDWLSRVGWMEMLCKMGPLMSVNRLIKMETFERRLRDNQSLSFLEICYPICQAYDFLHLAEEYGCTCQVGASDQWGNMLAGSNLKEGLFGMTCPLLTDGGKKISKTENCRTWLDPALTSPFDLWQFFKNLSDKVLQELHYLNFDRKASLQEQKSQVADIMTALVHGEEAALEARQRAERVYLEGRLDQLPHLFFKGGSLCEFLHHSGLSSSKAGARRLVREGGAKINGVVTRDELVEIREGQAITVGKRGYVVTQNRLF